jgi:glutathione S-transferase
LCDVKIKITEYFPGARSIMGQQNQEAGEGESFFAANDTFDAGIGPSQPFGVLAPPIDDNPNLPGANGQKYYTIQRVNGNNANGKDDAVGGGHKHTLEESDRVKKNSIFRELAKEEKEKKKTQVNALLSFIFISRCLASIFKRAKICIPLSEL